MVKATQRGVLVPREQQPKVASNDIGNDLDDSDVIRKLKAAFFNRICATPVTYLNRRHRLQWPSSTRSPSDLTDWFSVLSLSNLPKENQFINVIRQNITVFLQDPDITRLMSLSKRRRPKCWHLG